MALDSVIIKTFSLVYILPNNLNFMLLLVNCKKKKKTNVNRNASAETKFYNTLEYNGWNTTALCYIIKEIGTVSDI